MKKIILAIIYLLFHYNPTKGAEDSSQSLICLQFIDITPSITLKGKLNKYMIDTTHIYFYNGITLMEQKFYYSYKNDAFPKKNIDQVQTQYWIYKTEDTYGYMLDTFNKANCRWLLLDSFIKKQPYYQNGGYLYDAVVGSDLKLRSSTTDNDNRILNEKYFAVNKQDTTLKSYFYFSYDSTMNDIGFSLCTKLDSTKGMKLYRYNIKTLKRYWPKGKINIDEMDNGSSIKKINPPNKENILEYFNQFTKLKCTNKK